MRTLSIYLVRHGLAAERGPAWPDDTKRPLVPRGVARLRKEAQALRALSVVFDTIHELSDDEVIEHLTVVKGIGVWTAHMFLIFSLGRLDVLPHGDYGVRSAIQKLYKLEDLPDRETCHRIAEPWRPYASIASWYCWRSLEL